MRKSGVLTRSGILVTVRVGLDHRVANSLALDGDDELDAALVADVGVEAVVLRAGNHEMLHVYAPAEHLQAIVSAVVHLDVIDLRGTADTRRSQPLQLAV